MPKLTYLSVCKSNYLFEPSDTSMLCYARSIGSNETSMCTGSPESLLLADMICIKSLY